MDTFIPYAKQSIDASDIEAVAASLHAPLITRGPKVTEFEQAADGGSLVIINVHSIHM